MPGRISHSRQGATTHGRTAGTTASDYMNGYVHDSVLYYALEWLSRYFELEDTTKWYGVRKMMLTTEKAGEYNQRHEFESHEHTSDENLLRMLL